MNKMHIYPQSFWHTPATIVGNTEAIQELIKALELSLSKPEESITMAEVSVNDGEGYIIRVIRTEDEERWKNLKYPYTDPDCDNREGKVWP